MQNPTMQRPVIGGYIIVAHQLANSWSNPTVTHAFKDLATAEKHVRARIAELNSRPFDAYNGEFHPTLHAVSPRLFEKVQERLSRNDYDYENFAYRLGEAITRRLSDREIARRLNVPRDELPREPRFPTRTGPVRWKSFAPDRNLVNLPPPPALRCVVQVPRQKSDNRLYEKFAPFQSATRAGVQPIIKFEADNRDYGNSLDCARLRCEW